MLCYGFLSHKYLLKWTINLLLCIFIFTRILILWFFSDWQFSTRKYTSWIITSSGTVVTSKSGVNYVFRSQEDKCWIVSILVQSIGTFVFEGSNGHTRVTSYESVTKNSIAGNFWILLCVHFFFLEHAAIKNFQHAWY